MDDPESIDVVVCTWNSTKPWFRACLQSIEREVPLHCLTVVDRRSEDMTLDTLRSFFAEMKVLTTEADLAEARRQGIQHVDTTLFAFIDDDVELPTNWFHDLKVRFTEEVGAVHAQPFPGIDISYMRKWDEWLVKRGRKVGHSGKDIDLKPGVIRDMWGRLHSTIIRTAAVRDWTPPPIVTAGEDYLLTKHVLTKGLIWRIIDIPSIKHYSYRGLRGHFAKVRWYSASNRLLGLGYKTPFGLLKDSIKQCYHGARAGWDTRDPRVACFVLLERSYLVMGYLMWRKYLHIQR